MRNGVNGRRRRLVAASATVLAGVTGGCSAISDWTEDRAQEQRERIPRLCRSMDLSNLDGEPHVFHVLIERDGEIMRWWESAEVPARTTVQSDLGSWHRERGQYTIYASYDDYPDWSRRELSDRELGEDQACILPQVRITDDEHIGVITTALGKGEYSTSTLTEDS